MAKRSRKSKKIEVIEVIEIEQSDIVGSIINEVETDDGILFISDGRTEQDFIEVFNSASSYNQFDTEDFDFSGDYATLSEVAKLIK